MSVGRVAFGVVLSVLALVAALGAAKLDASERGERALLGRAFNLPAWSAQAYKNAWRGWNDAGSELPRSYDAVFQEHYGLHPAPYANGHYPMGLRQATGLLTKGIATDCLLCHGGSIAGRSYVGLGNASLDIQALFEDLAAADGRSPKLPFTFSNVRGTSEAGAMAAFLLGWREP